MAEELSRRAVLATTTGAALAAASPSAAAPVARGDLQPLTSRSGVYTPARGDGVMQFSFDFPEPSAAIGDLQVSFRIQTFENVYAVDPARTRILREGAVVRWVSEGLLGAGGQEPAAGRLTADFQIGSDGVVSWRAKAEMAKPVKSITTVVRGLPRGQLSISGGAFTDPKDDERIFEYPQLFGGMSTPLAMLKAADGRLFELSSRQTRVRPARFFFQPGPDGYRVELIHEHEGWARSGAVETPQWRVGPAASYETAAGAHFAHVEKAYAIPRFASRPDAPKWMHDVGLVLSIHGAHWTGYIFNDYARTLEILRWAATQTDPRRTMVFLPAWDGRYYWNYPLYQPDARMGGADGFRRLVDGGHALGFRMVPMFGANSANAGWPQFKAFSDATSEHVDGDAFDLNWVDWDNDRRNEGWMPFMNLGVPSWRRWLSERISATIRQFGVDAYFLDIAGAWENNRKADMNEGTRALVADIASRHPGVPPIGEMLYDAQMAYIPMSQVTRYASHPAGHDLYVRSYEHLSRPAPGRGSTGVHEAGFSPYKPDVAPDQRAIPTLTVVDDTFDKHRDAMAAYIALANAWMARRR